MKVTTPLLLLFVLICIFLAKADRYHGNSNFKNPKLKSFDDSSEAIQRDKIKAKDYIQNQKKKTAPLNTKKAKNLILFIGDGLSIVTSTATRVYMGGEEVQLANEKFPYFGLSRTYCVDKQVCDSASSTTALLTGIKTNYGVVSLSANVTTDQCTYGNNDVAHSIVKWAQDAEKSTGIVTTARVTDATMAAAYAHSPSRHWENDQRVSAGCRGKIKDIADQLVSSSEGSKLKVILGGGRQNFITTTTTDDEGTKGLRQDGRNLINEWLTKRSKLGSARYVWNKSQLDATSSSATDYLLGLFEADNCMYNLDVIAQGRQSKEPSLSDMTKAAVNVLKKDPKGFMLVVEGGRIDHAHHNNYARKALDETAEFSKAIETAKSLVSDDDTLIVVTGDHANVMTMAGYPPRRNDILKTTFLLRGDDNIPYETLSYANGPGYSRTFGAMGRNDITNDNFEDINRQYSATVPLSSSTHGGEDVGVYATGPWSHLFTGSYEQNEIPVAMAYAAKIGPYA